jgi:hypothetical protein
MTLGNFKPTHYTDLSQTRVGGINLKFKVCSVGMGPGSEYALPYSRGSLAAGSASGLRRPRPLKPAVWEG